ncbi:hypothetical protein FB451DRAFT_1554164 [Mycena latifolia]|nr:hypothetical protein FB451DRAFT_1554164 [Mycena latifolia]
MYSELMPIRLCPYSSNMPLGWYTCVLLGATLVRAAPAASNCPPTDRDGSSLLSQDSPDGIGVTTTCRYAGGENCLYVVRAIQSLVVRKAVIDVQRPWFGELEEGNDSCPDGLVSSSEGDPTATITSDTTDAPTTPPTTSVPTAAPPKTSTNNPPSDSPTKSVTRASSWSLPISSPISTNTRSTSSAGGPPSASVDGTPILSLPHSSSATSAEAATSTSIGGQTSPSLVVSGRKSSISSGGIAGIIIGSLTLLVFTVLIIFYSRRRRNKADTSLSAAESAENISPVDNIDLAPTSQTVAMNQEYLADKSPAVAMDSPGVAEISPSTAGFVGGDADNTLEEARLRIQAQQERISLLESQLHSQVACARADEPPPGCLE